MTLDASGNIYGTTDEGGASEDGTVFEVSRGSGSVTTLVSFNRTDGAYPEAGLSSDALGNLFGTTAIGGTADEGTVFEIPRGSSTMTTIASYSGPAQSEIVAGVAVDDSDNLYGTIQGSGSSSDGAVFEVAAASGTFTTLASFPSSGIDGSVGNGITLDAAGDLIGATWPGTSNGSSTVFTMSNGSGAITTIATFDSNNGFYPSGTLAVNASGDFFGTTWEGGSDDDGTVFELPEGSNLVTTIASFNGANGDEPQTGVVLDSSGDLFGTTQLGGADAKGTLFEVASGSNEMTTLVTFNGTNGSFPESPLTVDAAGNVYGVQTNIGIVFEIPHGSSTMTTVASFPTGVRPSAYAGVTIDASGDIYGTTLQGGSNNDGTVFEIAKGSNIVTTIASFNGTNGKSPEAGVTLDASGDIYGATSAGGQYSLGTVFEIARGSNAVTTLGSFNFAWFTATYGWDAASDLTLDPAGNLFGTSDNSGAVYEVAKGSDAITVLQSFDVPEGGVILDASGDLYGTSSHGGVVNGILFEMVPNTAVSLSPFGGPNPSTAEQALTFAATVEPTVSSTTGVPDGETVTLVDTSNNNTIVATGSLSGSSATLTIPGGTLSNLIAVYGGDANFAASESAPYAQTVLASPIVTSISPSSGPAAGGTTVTITGGGFTGSTAVDFGSMPATSFTVNSTGTQITAVDPAGTGTVDVTVVTPGGTSATSSADQFTYTASTVTISSVVVNGNNSALAGVQRSMVNSIEYTFSQAVILNQTNAFSIAVHSGQSGTVPTLTWTPVNPDASGGSTQWVVSFSGAGVSGGSIANGVYDIILNASGVTAEAGGSLSANRTDTFYRLFGDAQGTKNVSTADYNAFLSTNGLKSTAPGYLAYFAADGTGKIDTADYNVFLADLGVKLSGFTPTI